MGTVLGVDGCPGGWLGARADGSAVDWFYFPRARDVLAVDADAIGIDIPIGLPEEGPRQADLAAKRRLGAAHSSVFLAPVRAVLGASSYEEACALSRDRTGGKAISRQAWGLVPRIREVDELADDPRLVEVHPELSLRAAARDLVIRDSKHSARGLGQRLYVLRDAGLPDLLAALADVPRPARLDDALDALAVAWSAQRWLQGVAEVLPSEPPPIDGRGRPMRIVV